MDLPIGTTCDKRVDMVRMGYHCSMQRGICVKNDLRSIVLSGKYRDRIKGKDIEYIGCGIKGDQIDASSSKGNSDNVKMYRCMDKIFAVWVGGKGDPYTLHSYAKLVSHEYKYHDTEGRMCNIFHLVSIEPDM